MARIWMEGFEDGFPHGQYLEGSGLYSTHIYNFSINFPYDVTLATGRNAYSAKALRIASVSAIGSNVAYKKITALSELYFRTYFKYSFSNSDYVTSRETIYLKGVDGNVLIALYGTSTENTWDLYVRKSSTYTKVGSVTLTENTWHKVEFYLKVNAATGAYEIRIDDAVLYLVSGIDTGSSNIETINIGQNASSNIVYDFSFDDMAVNDTTGTINNSWCGNGTIVGLKPNGVGNKSQWTSSQGWTLAEASTTTEALMITGHGLATNDVIYNVTRDAYRIVTKTNDNELAISAIAGQVAGDTIVAFANIATIAAGAGTGTSSAVLPGHTLESYDVFVNTTRSNEIRRVIYVSGNTVYNRFTNNADYTGETVTSQAAGDSIKTFKVKYFAISDHYETVNQANPNPQYANIQSGTSAHIDTFDMQELVADLAIPSNASIIAVSNNLYAKEKGSGSRIKSVLRIDGTDYEGAEISLGSGTLNYGTVYDVSPDTSAQWTISEIDSIEAGVEVV